MFFKKKLFVFDVDGTLAQCRDEPILEENKRALQKLILEGNTVLIVSAGSSKRIMRQLNASGPFFEKIHIMGNYGLDYVCLDRGFVVKEQKFSFKEQTNEKLFSEIIFNFRKQCGFENYVGESHIRSGLGLIAIALLGTEASKEDKKNFDPDGKKRRVLIRQLKEALPTGFKAYVAGQSSIDIIDKKHDKRSAILRFATEKNFKKDEILFFGDEITLPYGNDSSLLKSGIDYIEVKDHREVAKLLGTSQQTEQVNEQKFA